MSRSVRLRAGSVGVREFNKAAFIRRDQRVPCTADAAAAAAAA